MCKLTSSLGKHLQWYVENGWLPAIPEEGEVPANLEDCSWNMIQQLVAADTFKNYYKVGDTKSVTLSTGEVVYMQVASINDGGGDAGAWYPKGTVDFISKDCLQTTYMIKSPSGAYMNWSSTTLRTTLNDTIIGTLPIELQNVIAEKNHKTASDQVTSTLVEHSDKLWIPTAFEVFGNTSYSASTEDATVNKMYGIFTDSGSRIKHYGTNGKSGDWWLCSTMNGTVGHWCGVTSTGISFTKNNLVATTTPIGVPLCFRVG